MFTWFWSLAQAVPDPLAAAAQFGVAGLMGGLWWWERRYSRSREDQLTEAHQAIVQEREHLAALLAALQDNTRAISQFTASHEQLVALVRERVAVRSV